MIIMVMIIVSWRGLCVVFFAIDYVAKCFFFAAIIDEQVTGQPHRGCRLTRVR